MATNYSSGRSVEYRVADLLRLQGYTATRTAGSHGVADVIAWNRKHVVFVQVKRFTTRLPSYEKDVEAMRDMKAPPGSERWLAVYKAGDGWAVWLRIDGGWTVEGGNVPVFGKGKQ